MVFAIPESNQAPHTSCCCKGKQTTHIARDELFNIAGFFWCIKGIKCLVCSLFCCFCCGCCKTKSLKFQLEERLQVQDWS